MPRFCQDEHAVRRVCSIIGASLLLAPSIIHFVWGNLSIYVLSYIYRHTPSVSGAQASWASSLYLMAQALTILPSGHLIRIVGVKKTAILGVILFNAGVFASYFAIQSSLLLVNVTLGALSGVGGGLLYGVCTDYGVQWSAKGGTGVITSIIHNSYNVMSIVANQLITLYINPDNETPSVVSGEFIYFSQQDVLSRVPRLFLILGITFAVCQIIGLVLARDCPSSMSKSKGSGEDVKKSSLDHGTRRSPPQGDIEQNSLSPDIKHSKTKSATETPLAVKDNVKDERSLLEVDVEKPPSPPYSVGDDDDISDTCRNLTPRQLLSTASFHFLWVAFFTSEFTFMMVTVNYKAFGQLWINDDYFLTVLGTIFVVVIVVVKTLSGVAMDRIGIKYVLMFVYATTAVCDGFLYVAPRVDKWLYSFLVIVLVSTSGTAFLINTVAIIKLYGRQNAVVNLGLLNISTILMMLIAPPTMELLMNLTGWAGVFFTGAGFSVVGLLLVTIGLPRR